MRRLRAWAIVAHIGVVVPGITVTLGAYLDTFAAAYAEVGRFDDAVRTQRGGRGAHRGSCA